MVYFKRVSAVLPHLWSLILATIVQICSCSGNSHVLCLESERHALLQFKKDLIDPSNRLSSWTPAEVDCCKWAGVVCHNLTGHVKELHLQNPKYPDSEYQAEVEVFERFKLQGNINPSLIDLKYLSYLDLSYNDFGGSSIPAFIGSLGSLTYLNISRAGFHGLVPTELGNLSNLRYLIIQAPFFYQSQAELYGKNLHWLYGLSSLVHLELSGINLTAASDWLLTINSLPSLLELHLSNCGLVLIPSISSVNFTSLSVLDLSDNSFGTSIPKWILGLKKINRLNLSSSDFEGPIPNGFSNLTSLVKLDLSYNDLTSPLPDWLFSLDNLLYLALNENDFDGPIPSGLQNLTALRHLDLSQIDFTNSTIPEWMYKLSHLEYLDLRNTKLQGKISSSIQNLTSLVTLFLSDNELEGTIPKTMGNLCKLEKIDLHRNKMGGSISEAFESLSGCTARNLWSLQLANNSFSGHLTDQIGILENLSHLDLRGNLISGSIPESLGRLSSLTYIDLSRNQLTGTLPQSLRNLSNLTGLYISHNKLEDIVSEVHFTNLTNLRELVASDNNITLKVSPTWVPPFRLNVLQMGNWNLGVQFPLWLQYQDHLSNLDLSCTGISGDIPAWFWNLTSNFKFLNLSHNQIHGELPGNFESKAESSLIYLGSNQFEGPIPHISANITELDLSNNSLSGSIFGMLCETTTSVNRLKILHLGENYLSGEIPDCWMNWPSLKIIKMGNNNLTGKIPRSIALLSRLQSLHLRNNNFSGEIPKTLENCKELMILDLGLNNFVGEIPTWLGSLENLKVLGLRSNKLVGAIPSEFCYLTSLQILDLANNNLSGLIPKCLNNLTAMAKVQSLRYLISYSFYYGVLMENAFVVTKGREEQYNTILTLVTSMDISDNRLSGEIPQEITALLGLRSLNLSQNNLTGEIPVNIGDMQVLESVDLSGNQISGKIPPSMSTLHFLSYLNLSNNNLRGEIPRSTQLQSLDASSFVGNRLCGPPLTQNCSAHEIPPDTTNQSEKEVDGTKIEGFYLGIILGFVVGFWVVCGPLLYSYSWRYAYYQFLHRMWHKLYSWF